MKINLFQTQTAKVFQEAVKLYRKQFNAISKNIANVNNPNFVRESTDFDSTLRTIKSNEAVKTSSNKHITNPHFYVQNELGSSDKKDQSVDLTKEMTALAENQVKYEFATRFLNRYYSGLSQAITGRPR
ncbi:MAG: flagellar basal body rod protein FlgB [FCB group bacterium]|nr:flagellar basal body rod protein FlgB [FCB group bacterium]